MKIEKNNIPCVTLLMWTFSVTAAFVAMITSVVQSIVASFIFGPLLAAIPWGFFFIFGNYVKLNPILNFGCGLSYYDWVDISIFVSLISSLFIGRSKMLVCPVIFVRTCIESVELMNDYLKSINRVAP